MNKLKRYETALSLLAESDRMLRESSRIWMEIERLMRENVKTNAILEESKKLLEDSRRLLETSETLRAEFGRIMPHAWEIADLSGVQNISMYEAHALLVEFGKIKRTLTKEQVAAVLLRCKIKEANSN